MAATRTRKQPNSDDAPSLFDPPADGPIVRIGGVDPVFVASPDEVDDEEIEAPRDGAVRHATAETSTMSAARRAAPTLSKVRAAKNTPAERAPTKPGKSARQPAAPPPPHRASGKATAPARQAANLGLPPVPPDVATPDPADAPPTRTPPPRKRATAESMAEKQRDISVSEFFAKNRHLLGFDNKRKALLTTVKEAVDNSLDACEEAGILPDIFIAVDQLAEERFRVTVRDNGPGIVKQQIPNVFGKLLYGSKFHRLKMSRGQQGIGISAAGMYGLLTTGKPIHVTSRTSPKKPAHHFQIAIDTTQNKPDTVADEEQEVEWEHGTEVQIELVASYAKGRQSVDEYVEQTAIANPHARFCYRSPTGENRECPRGSDQLPAETKEIQPHPHGIELGVLMKMLKEAGIKGARIQNSKGDDVPTARTLSGFLQERFCRVTTRVAHDICDAAKLRHTSRPAELSSQDAERLFQAMQTVKIMAPPTDCLAPIGVRNLLAGLLKEVKAEFFTATTRDPSVYRGNPFLIEVGIAFGGELARAGDSSTGAVPSPSDSAPQQPARIIRFANRVPLLYQQSACSSFKSVLDVDWRNYGLSQPGGNAPVGPLVVMIHMASVWVPFTSESKEAIADYDEIRKEMKLALQECGRKLASYIRRRKRQRLEGERRSIFERYIIDVAESLNAITGGDDKSEFRLINELQAIARSRTAEADVELDEDGKPIQKTDEPEADELSGDESTVIVAANAAAEPVTDTLFEDSASEPPARLRRKRRS